MVRLLKKNYSCHAPHQKVVLSYPQAPQFRCNIVFYPVASGGELRYVPPYTYGVVPQAADGKFVSLSLTLPSDSEERWRGLLKEAA